jgi:transcriptional regulator with XRE-family HTH domain
MARVKQIRQAYGLTQEQFAERAGLDYKYYQHVEAGRRPNLGLETLLKLSKGCGLELRQLFDFDAPPLVIAEPKGNEFSATPRPAGRKSSKPNSGGKPS